MSKKKKYSKSAYMDQINRLHNESLYESGPFGRLFSKLENRINHALYILNSMKDDKSNKRSS